jgi:RNA-directed DNA polymerase
MTAMVITKAGAPDTSKLDWDSIDWNEVKAHVYRLQTRIAKAFREGKHGKVKALQWMLTHSFYAKLLAIKRVTQNKGAKTPGIDNVLWKTAKQKVEAANSLKRRGYKTKPLRRIYIPKKQKGKLRPLSIPTMKCRAFQALHLLALDPVAEMMVDKNAYGFRPFRCTADAVKQCFHSLSQKGCAQYILEGDIESCFDTISHQWLLENIQMDKQVLAKWLSAGYVENGSLFPTRKGVPQGGGISPTLLNITLSGLEDAIHKYTSKRYDKSSRRGCLGPVLSHHRAYVLRTMAVSTKF